MKRFRLFVRRRLTAVLLCLALLIPQAAFSETIRNGQIRVLLTRPVLTDEVWMTLEGRYLARCGDGTEVMALGGADGSGLMHLCSSPENIFWDFLCKA